MSNIQSKDINMIAIKEFNHLQADTKGKYIKYINSIFAKAYSIDLIDTPIKSTLRISDRANVIDNPFSLEDLKTLLRTPMDKTLYEYLYISIHTGCRIGEVLALTPEDFRDQGVYITKAKNQYGTIGTPKTKSSIRFIPMQSQVFQTITKDFRIDFSKESSGSIRRRFYTIQRRAHIEPLRRPHDIRHTFATLLIRNGAPISDVSRLMGHSKISQTLNVYTHSDNNSIRESVGLLKGLQ